MVETSYNEFEDDFEDNFDIDDENEELEFGASWTINAISSLLSNRRTRAQNYKPAAFREGPDEFARIQHSHGKCDEL